MNRRRLQVWIIGALVLFIVILQIPLFSPLRDGLRRGAMAPINILSNIGRSIKSTFTLFGSIGDLSQENANLQARQIELEARIAQLESVEGENKQLKKDLNFSSENKDLNLLPADILSYSPISGYQAITIARGSNDGVRAGQAVVSGGFLVGKVNSVDPTTAEVWLLQNRSLLTPIVLTKSQTTGILKGGIRGLVVDNIPVDTQVDTGEFAVTSSLENLFPPNIPVGQVEEITSKDEEIFISLRISSPVNIGNIRTVFVVTN